ncbi:hypothetical protein Rsub_11351 [Raphidocelis subcapitata]|uniref:Tyrosine-protein kinase ephrin type A/B receptor-like domain-containing protein n=1 Tax=Raphidocelis subcapitata TaxID=307507 RepID=A0A2V0PLC3_9CHLO|nr:hypothetical protein Rsub_11351 [Raphidocelis subcapitata]|eukprot:GBF97825.1 hypothetical protein Rsub_11351 [Raphidocelis subcapitata]
MAAAPPAAALLLALLALAATARPVAGEDCGQGLYPNPELGRCIDYCPYGTHFMYPYPWQPGAACVTSCPDGLIGLEGDGYSYCTSDACPEEAHYSEVVDGATFCRYCPGGCKSCNGPDVCLACYPWWFLIPGTPNCVDECMEGYSDYETMTCRPCMETCNGWLPPAQVLPRRLLSL